MVTGAQGYNFVTRVGFYFHQGLSTRPATPLGRLAFDRLPFVWSTGRAVIRLPKLGRGRGFDRCR